MTAANKIINILRPYLEKIENRYMLVGNSDDIDRKKCVYAVGEGGIVITVLKSDASLTIQVLGQMSLENTKGYLTCRGLPETLGGFAYKKAEEVQDILEKLCDILLETPVTNIDVQIVKKKVMEAEFACYQKYHQIPESTMQSMKFEAERAELNILLKKG